MVEFASRLMTLAHCKHPVNISYCFMMLAASPDGSLVMFDGDSFTAMNRFFASFLYNKVKILILCSRALSCLPQLPMLPSPTPKGNVYMYYELYGFTQSLYQYILSRSNSQLMGRDIKDVENCAPFKKYRNGTPSLLLVLRPTAYSMVDTILSYNLNSSIHIRMPMLSSDIVWWTDKYVKFQNPSSSLPSAFAGTTKPPYWPKPVYELDDEDSGNNGFTNDHFIVWMRTAAFPIFKKLYHQLS
ncbi:Cell cycle control protein 50C [Pteropus alecto]|uniref:Cell cycle control protein 50C n=1 Tax=Pteropus alecto TaxID=9402 RepID=L5KAI3_PTEAL|nr:Cell cycle control protein 50C [Pteropus alecto]